MLGEEDCTEQKNMAVKRQSTWPGLTNRSKANPKLTNRHVDSEDFSKSFKELCVVVMLVWGGGGDKGGLAGRQADRQSQNENHREADTADLNTG